MGHEVLLPPRGVPWSHLSDDTKRSTGKTLRMDGSIQKEQFAVNTGLVNSWISLIFCHITCIFYFKMFCTKKYIFN